MPDLIELAGKIERQCNAADRRAQRRCTVQAEVRLDSPELRPLIAAARAVQRIEALIAAPPNSFTAFGGVQTSLIAVDDLRAALGGDDA